jgi:Xaa-Pro aminopeptidase
VLDAGVELESLYTAGITRTFPIGGKFTEAQREVYDLVREAQRAALAEVRPGQAYGAFEQAAMRVLASELEAWGLLPVSAGEALSADGQQHRRFIVCGTGHSWVWTCTTAPPRGRGATGPASWRRVWP